MIRQNNYTVIVLCATYNHARYIVDAMNGFCKQETSFPVINVILDDASLDGEQEIIKSYVQENFDLSNTSIVREEENEDYKLLFAQHKTNINCYFAVFFLKYNHYSIEKEKNPYFIEWRDASNYIALCEGDDCWVDPLKLQKQVDYMEAHPEVGVCYTDHNLQYDCDPNIVESMFQKQHKYRPNTYEEHLLKPGYLAPMTWLIRRELWLNLDKKYADGSYVMMLEWLHESKVAYLPMVTATYRTHKGSASNPIGEKKLFTYVSGVFGIQKYYTEKYPCSEELKRKVLMHGYMDVLPVAVMADNDEFVKEAQAYMESEGVDISLIIRELKQGEQRKRSKAYRLGKALLQPFRWLKHV